MNIAQFVPYFPPHKGGLETVAEEIALWRVNNSYGECYNITFDVGQKENILNEQLIKIKNKKGNILGYKINGYEILCLPSFDIVFNFPFPKIRNQRFRQIIIYIKNKKSDIVITHTRFFLSSFIGGIFSKLQHKKRIHIEHGSDYVKVGSNLKSKIAWLYDQTLGRWTFRNANIILPISEACKKFSSKFTSKEMTVFYRGIEFNIKKTEVEDLKEKFKGKIIVGFIGRLLKRKNVDTLIRSYYALDTKVKSDIQIVIIGNGEELVNLKKIDKKNEIYFTGAKPFNEAIALQAQFDIHIHTSSPGGGLATTLLQAMNLGCLIVATPYEGADEVIKDRYNGFLVKNDSKEEIKKGIEIAIKNISKKKSFSEINKEIIKAKFDWAKNIEKLYILIK